MQIFKKIIIFFLITAVFAVAAVFDALCIEPNLLIVKNENLYIPNWDKGLNGFKVAVISDLHIGSKFVDLKKAKTISKKINSKNPDLVVFLGDFDSKTIQNAGYKKEELTEVFASFKNKYGKIAILGNHDYATPMPVFTKKFLKDANVTVLENSSKTILVNGKKLTITGFKDPWYFDINPEEIIKPPIEPSTIVLSHSPDTFPEIPGRVSLSLSGHTHGGEINFPFFGSPVVPSKFGQRYRKGYIVEDGKHLYVSGGVATLSGARFLNPPEVSILTLYCEDSKHKIKNTKPKTGFNEKHWKQTVKFYSKLK